MNREDDATIESICKENNYTHLRNINGAWCALHQFMFTTGLIVDIGKWAYVKRYCYEHSADAAAALAEWDGNDHPSGPWIKCKGTINGEYVDLLNPKIDSFYPDGKYS